MTADEIMKMDPRGLLETGIGLLGLQPDRSVVSGLLSYVDELARWNRRFGFVNTDDKNELVLHVLDALAAAPLIRALPDPGPVLDLGSGAGLPGVPLAFLLPERAFFLCERKAKEAAFLRNVSLLGGLKNVKVFEDLRLIPGRAGMAIFRAVKTVEELLPILIPALAEDGIIVAYKGTLSKTAAEVASLGTWFRQIWVQELVHPILQRERHAIVLRKSCMESPRQ